jgi:hypothetical protein
LEKEERIATGFGPDDRGEGGDLFPLRLQLARQDFPDSALVEGRKGDLDDRRGLADPIEQGEHRGRIGIVVAIRRGDEGAGGIGIAGEGLEQLQARGIGPLKVVQEEEDRGLAGDDSGQLSEKVVKSIPRELGINRQEGRLGPDQAFQRGNDIGDGPSACT